MADQSFLTKIWVINLRDLNPQSFDHCRSILSEEEKAKMLRFRSDEDRDAYGVAHGLCRLALSEMCPEISPQSWQFEREELGKPVIATGLTTKPIKFNLSHTRGMVACIVSQQLNCGIDVEKVKMLPEQDDLAQMILAKSEHQTYLESPEDDRSSLFIRYWTLKESYLKAVGLGLNLAPSSIAFDLSKDSPCLLQGSKAWRFHQSSIDQEYIIAAAIHFSHSPNWKIHRTLPNIRL